MHVHHILRADFQNELADRLEKWKTFDISSRAADLCDNDVVFALIGKFTNAIFDYIGDMWNYLHGFAEVIAAPLF